MSRHEIEIEGLQEGWEPVAFRVPMKTERWIDSEGDVVNPNLNDYYPKAPRLIVRRKVRKYDWSKTLTDVLIGFTEGSQIYQFIQIDAPYPLHMRIAPVWQPNIHGKCPVDPEACIVRVKRANGRDSEDMLASSICWEFGFGAATIISWQFIRLADGYEW